jgi:hypothetical protein
MIRKKKKNSGVLTAKRVIDRLVKKALKNGFKAIPSRNHMYLKDVEEGEYFNTGRLKGIKIETGNMGTKVIVLDIKMAEEDVNYYLGKQLLGNKTEVLK